MSSFKIQSEALEQGVELINLTGEIDMDGSLYLHEYLEKLMALSITKIVIDLSKAEYINSRGIGVVTSCYKKCREAGGNLVLVNPSQKIRAVLQVTFLTKVLPIVSDKSEALNYFQNI